MNINYLNRNILYKSDFIAGDNKIIKDRTQTILNGFIVCNFELYRDNRLCDIKIQAITYKVSRDVTPIYTRDSFQSEYIKSSKNNIAGTILFISQPDQEQYDYLKIYTTNEYGEIATQQISNIELLNFNDARATFIAGSISDWKFENLKSGINNKSVICECGAESCGFTTHSSYCPKFK